MIRNLMILLRSSKYLKMTQLPTVMLSFRHFMAFIKILFKKKCEQMSLWMGSAVCI